MMKTIEVTPDLIRNFRSKYIRGSQEQDCWLWMAAQFDRGYGAFSHKGQQFRANRIAYAIKYPNFDQSLEVCHTCDNPQCVNPSHLFLGTTLDNALDKVQKGRSCKGVKNGQSKLTPELVDEIKRDVAAGVFQTVLARRHGVSTGLICHIVNGRAWDWV